MEKAGCRTAPCGGSNSGYALTYLPEPTVLAAMRKGTLNRLPDLPVLPNGALAK
jgi:hypothetical protein